VYNFLYETAGISLTLLNSSNFLAVAVRCNHTSALEHQKHVAGVGVKKAIKDFSLVSRLMGRTFTDRYQYWYLLFRTFLGCSQFIFPGLCVFLVLD